MNKKNSIVLVVMVLTAVMASAFATAATIPLTVDWIKVNGDEFDGTQEYERGEDLDIRVRLTAEADVADVEVEAYISGYRYAKYERDMVSDYDRIGSLRNGSSDTVDLSLQIPVKIETEDAKLRIRISNKNDESQEYTYQLDIVGLAEENAVQIKDFTVSPGAVVEAGRPLSFKVKVRNYGDEDLDDVSVKVAIAELGIADDETLDQIDADETETFEELLLRIPACATPGTYTVKATVEFDEYEETYQTMAITVLAGGSCEVSTPAAKGKTVVTVPENQEVVLGTTGGVYPVMISNLGSTAKTYTLTASGVDAWGTARFDPGAVVIVQPESVKTVYMYVAAKQDAQPGAQVFKLSVEGDGEEKQVVLTANVKEGQAAAGSYDSLRRGLEIGLIVLVVILIILGLIIGFNKLRGGKDDDSEESQTYY